MLLLTFGSWWSALEGIQQVFWAIAIVFSVLFVIQFVFSLIGLDMDADVDIDVSADGLDAGASLEADFSVFSSRGIIAFFTFFGWTGVLMLNAGGTTLSSIIAASVAGAIAMFIVGYMMYQFTKLNQEGNTDINNAIFNTGEVYLTIPAKDGGQGKVHINIEGSLKELDAITENGESLPTGSFIRVVEVINNQILLVEPVRE